MACGPREAFHRGGHSGHAAQPSSHARIRVLPCVVADGVRDASRRHPVGVRRGATDGSRARDVRPTGGVSMLRARACPSGKTDQPGRHCRSLWVSATLEPDWLETVDHPAPTRVLRVDPATEGDERLGVLSRAPKHLRSWGAGPESNGAAHERTYLSRLAKSVVGAHRRGRMTLVIVNRVQRAQNLFVASPQDSDLHGQVEFRSSPSSIRGIARRTVSAR